MTCWIRWCAPILALLVSLPAVAQVKDEPLAIAAVKAFPNLRIRRPVIITHAPGDTADRLFICEQQGVIRIIDNKEDVTEGKVFLDIEDRVVYKDRENEEGLLGMAFHPKFKENGQFFLYYNTTDKPHTCIISRFTVSKDNRDQADPKSEEEILRIPQPYWNHNGGTIAFGPDGMLYVGLGDGGAANDPHKNGQNLGTILGKLLRIDVDHHDAGMKYAIPKDNPFVGKEGAKGEIWAYGFRNIWRLSFDRQTGTLWVADVGQNIWEEINIGVKGGNYGWSLRESMHDFDVRMANPGPGRTVAQTNKPDGKISSELIDPIWEYHHDIGKSITGGVVYRGKKLPQLAGCYIYGDYVSGKQWALKYDEASKKVVANYALVDNKAPVMTYGEDKDGEVYFSDPAGFIYKFAEVKK